MNTKIEEIIRDLKGTDAAKRDDAFQALMTIAKEVDGHVQEIRDRASVGADPEDDEEIGGMPRWEDVVWVVVESIRKLSGKHRDAFDADLKRLAEFHSANCYQGSTK